MQRETSPNPGAEDPEAKDDLDPTKLTPAELVEAAQRNLDGGDCGGRWITVYEVGQYGRFETRLTGRSG